MYCNYEYIEAMKKQKEKHEHLLGNGNPLYCNEYGGGKSWNWTPQGIAGSIQYNFASPGILHCTVCEREKAQRLSFL